MSICWVDIDGFHLLAESVKLRFPDSVATFPLPKQKNSEKAFEEQYPELAAKVPEYIDRGFTYRRGLYFERVASTYIPTPMEILMKNIELDDKILRGLNNGSKKIRYDWSRISGEDKVNACLDMSEFVVQVCAAGIRTSRPDITDEELLLELRKRFKWSKRKT